MSHSIVLVMFLLVLLMIERGSEPIWGTEGWTYLPRRAGFGILAGGVLGGFLTEPTPFLLGTHCAFLLTTLALYAQAFKNSLKPKISDRAVMATLGVLFVGACTYVTILLSGRVI